MTSGLASGAEPRAGLAPIFGLFRDDEGGFTTIAVAVSLVLSLSLVFGAASATWVAGRSSEVQRVADAGKHSLVHVDLINGLAAKEIAADFIRSYTGADGIISTKPQLLRHAREVGLITVLRVFILDSMALDNIDKLRTACNPDLIELVPGIVPKVIRLVNSLYRTPIIAGGLIRDKEDTMSALSAGALCISTSCEAAWKEMGVS